MITDDLEGYRGDLGFGTDGGRDGRTGEKVLEEVLVDLKMSNMRCLSVGKIQIVDNSCKI